MNGVKKIKKASIKKYKPIIAFFIAMVMASSVFVTANTSDYTISSPTTERYTFEMDEDSISLTMAVGSYKITSTDQGDEIYVEEFGRLLIPGKPNLPSKIFSIAIPPGAEVEKVTIDAGEAMTIPGIFEVPSTPLPRVIGKEDPAIFEQDTKEYENNYNQVYQSDESYPPYIISSNKTTISEHISNVKITILSREYDIKGLDSKEFTINVSEGINRIQIYGNITSIKPNFVDPIIFLSLYDPIDNLVAYSSSLAFDVGSAYLETLITNASGEYTLVAKIYNGIKGGFFSQRGISIVDSDFDISYSISNLEKPHLPYIPNLSITASYLTAAHGGIILADSQFELTDESYAEAADGYSSGPWHNENLHNFTNEKVWYVVDQINNTLDMIDEFEMLNDYLAGPAWLAILAGTNMIPMYYYSPSQPGLLEKGLPSDNPYSLNWNLSVSRVIGWNVEDVSLMI
ncbi:unnamed protein product, partial [marine sediment metagenome]